MHYRSSIIVSMNRLTTAKRVAVVKALVEGCSIRSTVRLTGAAKNTVVKLLIELGAACAAYQDEHLRNLSCNRLQLDEIWSFVGKKDRQLTGEEKDRGFGLGSVWTWTAIDADTKLIPTWFVSSRDAGAAFEFAHDLASRINGRVQITSDGYKAYATAVPDAFGLDCDFAMLQKIYGQSPDDRRYSPQICLGCKVETVMGTPDPKHISTSHNERQNLTMRMSMRRFTRLTNAFSKKVENHAAAVALYFMYYNFARIHQTLRVTPAMEAGVSDRVWAIEEIVALLD